MSTALATQIPVSLQVPVSVKGEDGKNAERSKLVIRRPKTRHTKRLAVLVGVDLLEILLSSEDGEAVSGDTLGGRKLVGDVLRRLLVEDRLDGLTALIADLCDESPETIDDVDVIDLPALIMGFAGFFPKLQSAMSGAFAAISPSSETATSPQAQ